MLFNSQLFERLKNGTTVVVPDANYATNLRQQYGHWAACSTSAWQTPSILSWQDWLNQLWKQHQRLSGDCRIVLNAMQQRALWQQVIESDITRHTRTVLWNLSASINQARNAWRLLFDYDLDLSAYPHVVNDVRVFLRWQQNYTQHLLDNEWLDPIQLANLLIKSDLKLTEQGIEFFGFEEFTPLQHKFYRSVFGSPDLIAQSDIDSIESEKPVVYEFPDFDAELNACALWARELHESDPDINIGVLVADLSHCANKVEFIFKSRFVPDYTLADNQCDVFSISPKNKLIEKGLINSGLHCLELLSLRFDYELFSKFLTDTYIDRDEKQKHTLCLADIELRRIVSAQVGLDDLIEYLNRIQVDSELELSQLISQLQQLNAYRKTIATSVTIVDWCDHFAAVLKILKWPGLELLSSQDKQLFRQWDQLFASVCTAGLVYKQLNVSEALNLFKQTAAVTSFKGRQVRISVIDINEADGMLFDASWVCGLSDTVIPSPVKFNPLLPYQLQREHQLPFSSSEDCHARAYNQFQRLSRSAPEPKFSFYKNDEHLSFRVSPVLADYEVNTVKPLPIADRSAVNNPVLETYVDDDGLVLENNNAIGGSYLLKSQAQCPFKAYAEKRLSVEPIDKRDLGLDPAERGNLVHQLLHNLWKKLKSSSTLAALTDDELETLINQQVGRVINSLGLAHKLFVDVESKRLRSLALKWLKLEMSRDSAFSIGFLELPLTYMQCGLEFNLKVDRVDVLEDGSLLVIDYKTGNASRASWLDQRVLDPQMPVYYFALIQTQASAVTALTFANTKHLSFDGLSEVDLGIKGIAQVDNNNRGKLSHFDNWEQLIEHWNLNIETLAGEVKAGFASVTPDSLNNCKYCGRQSLCRINQHQSWQRHDD